MYHETSKKQSHKPKKSSWLLGYFCPSFFFDFFSSFYYCAVSSWRFRPNPTTMKISNQEIQVCDYCHAQHQQYMRNTAFDIYNKRSIETCTCCSATMCADCVRWSSKEIKGSTLELYWFYICRGCIVQYRRTTDFQERIEAHIQQQIEIVKEWMKHHIYHMTEKQWELLTH